MGRQSLSPVQPSLMVVFSSFVTGSASVAVRIIFCVVSDTGNWHTWTMLILFVSFSTSPLESSQLNDWKNALLSVSARYISGVIHTYPEICENAIFFLRIWLASARIQYIFQPHLEIFENALQSGNFFIQYDYIYVWMVVSGNFRIRFHHSLGSSLHGEHYKQTWRTARL